MRVAPIDPLRFPAFLGIRLVAVLAILALAGCSKDTTTNPNPGGGSTTYTGSVTGSTTSGKLTLTVATASPAPQERSSRAQAIVTATGTFTPSGGGTAVNLTGQYDDVGNTVLVSGTGWTFSGGLTNFGMDGIFTGPGGAVGAFSLEQGSTGVRVVLGTFTSTTIPPGANGNFNFSISGTEVHGNAVADVGGTPIPLDGTYTASNGAISIVNPAAPGPAPATGTYDSTAGTASGSYDDGAGNSGTWAGAKQP